METSLRNHTFLWTFCCFFSAFFFPHAMAKRKTYWCGKMLWVVFNSWSEWLHWLMKRLQRSNATCHGRHHITGRRIWYRITNTWNSSLEMHLAQKHSLVFPTAVFLCWSAHSSAGELFEGLTLPTWQKHKTLWGTCVSCAEPQTIAEPFLGDEGRMHKRQPKRQQWHFLCKTSLFSDFNRHH